MFTTYAGEIFSLLSAMFWGLAVVFFKQIGDRVSPIVLNPFKNGLGVILISATLLVTGNSLLPEGAFEFTSWDYAILIISGMVGLGIADVIFLHSLNMIGAGISALVDTLYSPFVILFAFLLLGETLNFYQIIGGLLIIGSIVFASARLQQIPVERGKLIYGMLLQALALALMAFGIVLVKPILNKVSDDVSMQLWVAGMRMIPGTLVPLMLVMYNIRKKEMFAFTKDKTVWKPLITGSVLATYLGISFWIIGMAQTQTSIAAILNQTATIFILIFARLILKEPLTKRRFIAVGIALSGVMIILLNQ